MRATAIDAMTEKGVWSFEKFHGPLIIFRLIHSFPINRGEKGSEIWRQCILSPSVVVEILFVILSIWFYKQIRESLAWKNNI